MKHLLIIFLVLFGNTVFSQMITISGKINSGKTSEFIPGATVYDTISTKGTISNDYGFYSISLKQGKVALQYSFTGYQKQLKQFLLNRDTVINIFLHELELPEVIITSETATKNGNGNSMVHISMKDIETLPVLMGETDILKSMQLLPGIQMGNEGTSDLLVRGGGKGQNLILLDGVPVYHSSHMFGFLSVFNEDAIKNADIYKGGFPARYGGRVSSVTDITMREGNYQKYTGKVSIGLLSSKFLIEGPIIKDKTSFLFCVRRSYIDLVLSPMNISTESFPINSYHFYDLNIKLNHRFSKGSSLFASFYTGNDKTKEDEKTINGNEEKISEHTQENMSKWGNSTFLLRWNRNIGSKLFFKLSGYYTKYRYIDKSDYSTFHRIVDDPEENYQSYGKYEYNSNIEDFCLNIAGDYMPSPSHFIQFGAEHITHNFSPGINSDYYIQGNNEKYNIDSTYGNFSLKSNELSAWLEDEITIFNTIKANAGLRYTKYGIKDKKYHSFEPRISVSAPLHKTISLHGGYSYMSQYILLLTNNTVSLPIDLWMPPTDSAPPLSSHQLYAGFTIDKKHWQLTVDAYYKEIANTIEYKEAEFSKEKIGQWEQQVESGDGYAKGIEFLLKKKKGRFTGWIAYTLSKSERRFPTINFGRVFAFKYDRRHKLNITMNYKLTSKWLLSSSWVYSSGHAITLCTGYGMSAFRALPYTQLIENSDELRNSKDWVSDMEIERYGAYHLGVKYYGTRNNYRIPSYHRLDIAATYEKPVKWGSYKLKFGVYNAYNHLNTSFIQLDTDYLKYYKHVLFPALPFISITLNYE